MKRVQRLKKSLLIRSMFLKYFLSTVRTPIAHGMALLLNGDGLTESIQNFEVTGFVLNLGKELFVEWDGHRHVVCDLLRKKIIRVDDSMLYTSKTVLDLNDEGERWEGEVHQGQPYGWGVLYDKEGEKKYEGFRIGDVNVCYGTLYYSDIRTKEYQGEWCGGQRWGRGTHFDRSEKVAYSGVWIRDAHAKRKVVITAENESEVEFCNKVECLEVQDNCCNGSKGEEKLLSLLPFLKELIVGNESFRGVDKVKLVEMENLERVVIGRGSFTNHPKDAFRDPSREFHLKDCPRVRELRIGGYSFSDFGVCEIENVPLLESVSMGDLKENHCCYSFYYASSLVLRSCTSMLK